jgi:SAM-dependent methyltransferase
MSEVYKASFFQEHVSGSLASARTMLPILFQYYQPQSVIDIGCGLGPWLKAAVELGAGDVLGIDGDYIDRNALLIPEENFHPADLQQRIQVNRRFDLAISMEVAEHLPYSRSETFIEDLVSLSGVVLFSAALPYQGGTDHINEQWLEFWAILFQRHSYAPYDFLRRQCWSNPDVEYWYSQNAVIFCAAELGKKTFPPQFLASGYPLSQLHPLTFLLNAARYRPLSAEALGPEWQDYQSVIRAYDRGDGTPPPLKMADASDGAGAPLFPRARMVITEAHAERAKLAGELEAARSESAALKEEISRQASSLQERERELAAVRRSLTWRSTEPLRRCAGWLHNLIAGRRTVRILRSCGLFDRDYYLAQNPDVAGASVDPIRHYVWYGAAEGRNPSPHFETSAYIASHPELIHSGMNPLLHYVLHEGNKEAAGP